MASDVNQRLSIGLQSATMMSLKRLGRIHTFECQMNYEVARNVGFKNINVDLMYGLPEQSASQYMATVNKIIRFFIRDCYRRILL